MRRRRVKKVFLLPFLHYILSFCRAFVLSVVLVVLLPVYPLHSTHTHTWHNKNFQVSLSPPRLFIHFSLSECRVFALACETFSHLCFCFLHRTSWNLAHCTSSHANTENIILNCKWMNAVIARAYKGNKWRARSL